VLQEFFTETPPKGPDTRNFHILMAYAYEVLAFGVQPYT